ncbi:TPA: Lar family restriction alleviation protein [Yersinia enterocolitica]|nr:Lar family restriction alleviation protein [Yersinia enterocolitica]HDV0804751.1 Lar family restriction alleviation protein [Yersinia enterocolitica]HDZ9669822.1 Lar family restriction alleviation protein [Yersinia enterocolitica]
MSENTDEKLKPCPFCGSTNVEAFAQYEEDCPDRSAIVRCHNCDAQSAQMIGSGKIAMAKRAWNKRVSNGSAA